MLGLTEDHLPMKHKLSKTEQAGGLRKALRSRKTPPWLKPAIRRYLQKLERAQKG